MTGVEKCGICEENVSKYKCPKCGIRYCSLVCYKNTDKHSHDNIKDTVINKKEEETNQTHQLSKNDTIQLPTKSFNDILHNSPELQQLLQYNTVKFHLHKIYRILTTDVSEMAGSSTNLNSDSKKQLAIDYLNTMLYGGIHYNEAVEEFCQICLQMLNKK